MSAAGKESIQLEQTNRRHQWRHSSLWCPPGPSLSVPQLCCVGVQTSSLRAKNRRKGILALTDFKFLLAIYYSLHAKVHRCSKLSLQSRHNFGERVFSIFLRKTLVAIFIYYSSGSGEEKEICTKGVNDGQKKIKGRGRGHRNYSYLFLPTPPPPSTLNQTW